MLTIKKLDEISILLFMSLYLIYDFGFKGYMVAILIYLFFYTMAKSSKDLIVMRKYNKNINNKMIEYSKLEKIRLIVSLPALIIGIGFNIENIVLIGYILFLMTYIYDFLVGVKTKTKTKIKKIKKK